MAGKQDILGEMQQSGSTVHVIGTKQAQPLLDGGYVRKATISPAPTKGRVAVNLTAKGRGYRGGKVDTPTDDTSDTTGSTEPESDTE